MSQITSRLLQILGLVLIVFGFLSVADGVLPMRSHGSNLSWAEIVIGVVLIIAGWIVRRVALNRLQRAAKKASDRSSSRSTAPRVP